MSSVATLAWINTEYFEQAITGDLATTKPIISISVEADVDPSDNLTNQDIKTSNNYQLNNITVISQNNQRFNGTKPSIPGFDINSPWDPISFDINTVDNSIRWDEGSPADVDKETQGAQVVVLIDISRSGIKEGDFNAYLKFVSAEALEAAGGSLIDLDGNAITSEGWYDFTQRVDEQGNYIGNGARFIIEENNDGEKYISKIQLTFTDESFGDNAIGTPGVGDPGMPVKLSQESMAVETVTAATETAAMETAAI